MKDFLKFRGASKEDIETQYLTSEQHGNFKKDSRPEWVAAARGTGVVAPQSKIGFQYSPSSRLAIPLAALATNVSRFICQGTRAILVLLLAFGYFASAEENTPQRSPQEFILKGESAEMPFRFYKKRPYIKARINGKKSYWFLVDTGASTCILRPNVVKQLGIATRSFASLGYGFTGVLKTDAICRVKVLRIGRAEFRNFDADVASLESKSGTHLQNEEIGGVLGFPLFEKCLFSLDYKNRRLKLTEGSLPPANGADVLNLHSFSSKKGARLNALPMINMQLESGEWIGGILDSGFVGLMAMPDSMFAQIAPKQTTQMIPLQAVAGAGGDTQSMRYGRIPQILKIGDYEIRHPLTWVMTSLESLPVKMAVMGNEILKKFTITFDQKNGRVRLASTNGENNVDYGKRELRIGKLNLIFDDVYWTVPETIEVQGKKLEKGDIVLLVENEPVFEWSVKDWQALVKKQKKVHLTVSRGEKILDIFFPLVFLPETKED
ncbi:MAG: retropepsin-like aspartic protease [Verrucomicrobiota bacterium]